MRAKLALVAVAGPVAGAGAASGFAWFATFIFVTLGCRRPPVSTGGSWRQ